MGVLGELFPGRKILDEAGEAGDGQRWGLGPIDLEAGVVTVRRMPSPDPVDPPETAESDETAGSDESDETAGSDEPVGPDDSVDG